MLARKCVDIKIRAVLFLTDFSTIKSRNTQRRNQGKYIDVSILEAKEKIKHYKEEVRKMLGLTETIAIAEPVIDS